MAAATLAEIRDWPIDRVVERVPGERIVALKFLPYNEAIFTEHFPEAPVYPGSMVLNSVLAAGAALLGAARGEDWRLGAVERASFRRPCTPGEILTITATLQDHDPGGGRVRIRFSVTGQFSGATVSNGTVVLRRAGGTP